MELQRGWVNMRRGWALWVWLAVGCSGGSAQPVDGGTDGGGDARAACPPAGFVCEGTQLRACGDGGSQTSRDCSEEGLICDAARGCVSCQAGQQSCSDGVATWCRTDGTLATFECDPVQGMQCEPDGCRGGCALPNVADSYIGCDYYPTVTLNPVWSGFEFAVAVSNAADAEARVTITRGDSPVAEAELAAGELKLFPLPWVQELKGGEVNACQQPPATGDTRVVQDGAYRVRSDRPVTVYQFSPLEYQLDPAPAQCPVNADCPGAPDDAIDDCLSYSNDASLLLPATALTGSYTVLSWPAWRQGAGFVTVTAVEDGTEVRMLGAGNVAPGAGIDGQGNGSVQLDRGDVLQLVAAPHDADGYGADLSGSRVRADKPVQVIGGHSCAQLPSASTGTCDHLEHALIPEDTLGSRYLATVPHYVNGSDDSPYVLRISAIEEQTSISFTPAVAPDTMLSPEDGPLELLLEADALTDVQIEGDKPLLVAQYLPGQQALPVSGIAGDPSMSLVPPIEQFRREYLFTAPTSFVANFVNVVAPAGAQVRLDGSPIDTSEFEALSGTDFAVARVLLSADRAVHTLEADVDVGLVVYGYGLFTSYMYPGGMDLERIAIPPII